MAEQHIEYQCRKAKIGAREARMVFAREGDVSITVACSKWTEPRIIDSDEAMAFFGAFEIFLEWSRPDIVITYGGGPMSRGLVELSKRREIPVVFAVHNFAHRTLEPFRHVDYAIVPSQYARQAYWHRLGLACQHLPYFIDRQRVLVGSASSPRYVTFVNPQLHKGALVFARIAQQLQARRPDIPLLAEVPQRWEKIRGIGA